MKKYDNSSELKNCNFVKAILMIFVVFYHCILYWCGAWFDKKAAFSSPFLSSLSGFLISFLMCAFVLASGYIFYYLRHECGKYTKYGSFLLNKAKRLLVPYLFASIIWVIPINLIFFEYSFSDYIKNFLFAISPSQLWFLVMLFAVFAIFWPLSNYFKEHSFVGLVIVLLMWCIGYVGASFTPNVFQIYTALKYVLFFYIGFKVRQFGSSIIMKIPAVIWVLVDVILFVVSRYLSNYNSLIFKLISTGVSLMLNIVGAFMAFVVLQKLANVLKWENSKWFGTLVKTSMPIYLFHQQIIYFSLSFLNGVVNPYVHAGINFVSSSILISLLISLLLLKFKWTRALIGEK